MGPDLLGSREHNGRIRGSATLNPGQTVHSPKALLPKHQRSYTIRDPLELDGEAISLREHDPEPRSSNLPWPIDPCILACRRTLGTWKIGAKSNLTCPRVSDSGKVSGCVFFFFAPRLQIVPLLPVSARICLVPSFVFKGISISRYRPELCQ